MQTKSETSDYITSIDSKNNNPISDFIFGICFLISAFPVLWNNERKLVKIGRLLKDGLLQCKNTDINNPSPDFNFKLVYGSGTTNNTDEIKDDIL